MPENCVKVARGLLLWGERSGPGGDMRRADLLDRVGVNDNTFRSAAASIGAKESTEGLRFFESRAGLLSFGPGAGLVLAISIGSGSVRAALVDANGSLRYPTELDPRPGQLLAGPVSMTPRLKEAAAEVLGAALDRDEFLVDGAVPLLGVATAWPSAIDREDRAVGAHMAHHGWRGSLSARIARALSIDPSRSHVLNDADAAAIAVAFRRTRARGHQKQAHPELTFVLRLAGGVGGATIVIEPPAEDPRWGRTSGFLESTLLGGVDTLAGEIGHVEVPAAVIERLTDGEEIPGLGPIVPIECSCTDPGEEVPRHLEALASAAATAHRIEPGRPVGEVLAAMNAPPREPGHRRALEDAGRLVAESLVGPIAWLNPAAIVITGALAQEEVRRAIDETLTDTHPLITQPDIRILDPADNDFIRVEGAGLAISREHVHRRLAEILGGPRKTLPEQVRSIWTPLSEIPWET